MSDNALLLTLAAVFYFFLHSLLAADGVKLVLKKAFPFLERGYRFFYNAVALLGLVGVYLLYRNTSLPGEMFQPPLVLKIAAALLLLAGVLLLLKAAKGYRLREFAGIDEWQQRDFQPELVTSGLNRWVRHPLYSATLLIIWSFWLIFPQYKLLLLFIPTTIYIFVGARLEEHKLLREFGTSYRQYRQRVKMLIPHLL